MAFVYTSWMLHKVTLLTIETMILYSRCGRVVDGAGYKDDSLVLVSNLVRERKSMSAQRLYIHVYNYHP